MLKRTFRRASSKVIIAVYNIGWREGQEISSILTPWCRVLLEQLTGLQLVKKFPAFHGTPRFITALTSVRQLSLSWASPIQSTYPHPPSWSSILILSTHLRLGLPSGLLPSGFPQQDPIHHPLLTHTCLYPGPDKFNPYTHIPPPGDPS